MPHNDILNDKKIREVFNEYVIANSDELKEKKIHIQLDKEPDYMFVVNWERKDVLTEQLHAIEVHYQTNIKRDRNEIFGLLENLEFRAEGQKGYDEDNDR